MVKKPTEKHKNDLLREIEDAITTLSTCMEDIEICENLNYLQIIGGRLDRVGFKLVQLIPVWVDSENLTAVPQT